MLLVASLPGLQVGRASSATSKLADPTVQIARPIQREIIEWDSYIGRFEASQTVQVRPRVSGQVIGIHFLDGAVVERGQLLFTLDPRPLVAALAQARAELAKAKTELALARIQAKRATGLRPSGGISQSDVDDKNAALRATMANVEAAEAVVRARELDVEFTEIRAPIAGQISDRRIDAGNQVAAGPGTESTLLTTINAVDPIYFSFNSSEALYLKTRRAREDSARTSRVEIRLQDESAHRWSGRLDFTDNGLDARSGTIRSRATVANPDHFLAPGLFGDMRLASDRPRRALLVPEASISSDLLALGRVPSGVTASAFNAGVQAATEFKYLQALTAWAIADGVPPIDATGVADSIVTSADAGGRRSDP